MTPEDRAWEVVRRAFAERAPSAAPPRRATTRRIAAGLAVAALAAVVAAAVSPPGRAVFHRVRQAVGVEHADPALFSLPAAGRLLVVSTEHGGVWLVRADGYKRKLGSYDDASWSPHGRFVAATGDNRLVALAPDGDVRWTLARRSPSSPAWEGTDTDTRIAYGAASGLRVVAGDGTGDHLLDRFGGPFAWDPARLHTLAYYTGGAIVLRRADGRVLWRRTIDVTPHDVEWSSDGRYLAVFGGNRVRVLDAAGRLRRSYSMLSADLITGAFRPGTHVLTLTVRLRARSEVRTADVGSRAPSRLVFAGPGDFGDLAWSPDGAWLLVTWPAANQWVFLRGSRAHAVANIEQEFPRHDGLGPLLQVAGRWCCATTRR
jgi:WD40 repeat protein